MNCTSTISYDSYLKIAGSSEYPYGLRRNGSTDKKSIVNFDFRYRLAVDVKSLTF